MAEPTITEVFGAGASQTLTTITIEKADLPGLTADANNTVESLLAAILLKAQSFLTQTTFDTNLDQSAYISEGYPTITFRGADQAKYRVDQLVINFAREDDGGEIDPDNY